MRWHAQDEVNQESKQMELWYSSRVVDVHRRSYSRSNAKRPLIEHIIVDEWRVIDNKSCLDWAARLDCVIHYPWVVATFIAEQQHSNIVELKRPLNNVVQPATCDRDFWRLSTVHDQHHIVRICWNWLRPNTWSCEKPTGTLHITWSNRRSHVACNINNSSYTVKPIEIKLNQHSSLLLNHHLTIQALIDIHVSLVWQNKFAKLNM